MKGVKSLSVRSGEGREKEERESGEIVVSAEYGESSAYVVSAASPTRDVEGSKSSQPQSHPQYSNTNNPNNNNANKKFREFREVGVGSADDNQDIRTSASTSK